MRQLRSHARMPSPVRRVALLLGAAAPLMLGACESDGAGEVAYNDAPIDAPLSDLAVMLEDVPSSDKLPDEPKADATYPAQFDLVALQTPVKNQASRGVCSIFATAALMEHLYLKEGSMQDPDFSEQFLQWSVKTEVGAFKTSEGSNSGRNLEAISKYGIVLESVWPYEGTPWSTSKDARCTGSERPTLCYTNGSPSEEVLSAKRWKLPTSRSIAARRNSIKAYMFQNKTAVTAGMKFFYQAWSHSGGGLPTNSEYSRKGYILYPNDADKKVAEEKPAGHEILIVGWDDTLEVQRLDEKGQKMVDANGNPITEKGFFLIKNSWGNTGTFGRENPHGHGYGWISMRYIEEYAYLYSANMPSVDLGPEICDDGRDNNYNNLTDCEDVDSCGMAASCNTVQRRFDATVSMAIPDNDVAGLSSTLNVPVTGEATEIWVEVNIEHPFIRDLSLVLSMPNGTTHPLYERDAQSGRNMKRRFLLPRLIGTQVQGDWTLTVVDKAQGDKGTFKSWSIGLSTAEEVLEICGDGLDNDGNGKIDCLDHACVDDATCVVTNPESLAYMSEHDPLAIPDQLASGVRSVLEVERNGTVKSVVVEVDIDHSYVGDLTISLIHPDGTIVGLRSEQGGNARNIYDIYEPTEFNGKRSAGEWTLWVRDSFAGDVGFLNAWMLEIDVQ